MHGNANWAVTAGNNGLTFAPGPGNSGATPPQVELEAVLPNGTKTLPALQAPRGDSELSWGFAFDHPLPDGTLIYMNGSLLHTV